MFRPAPSDNQGKRPAIGPSGLNGPWVSDGCASHPGDQSVSLGRFGAKLRRTGGPVLLSAQPSDKRVSPTRNFPWSRREGSIRSLSHQCPEKGDDHDRPSLATTRRRAARVPYPSRRPLSRSNTNTRRGSTATNTSSSGVRRANRSSSRCPRIRTSDSPRRTSTRTLWPIGSVT